MAQVRATQVRATQVRATQVRATQVRATVIVVVKERFVCQGAESSFWTKPMHSSPIIRQDVFDRTTSSNDKFFDEKSLQGIARKTFQRHAKLVVGKFCLVIQFPNQMSNSRRLKQ